MEKAVTCREIREYFTAHPEEARKYRTGSLDDAGDDRSAVRSNALGYSP